MAGRTKKNTKYSSAAANTARRGENVPAPRKRKRRGSPINVLTLILFAIIMLYLVKYAVDFASGGSDIGIETVDYGTIDIPKSFDGIVVRDEYVVSAAKSGEPSFNYGEGDKIKKNATVCTIIEGENARKAEDKLQTIDESIIETQKNRLDISKYKDDIVRTENAIDSAVSSAQTRIASGSFTDVYTLRSAVQTQMDLRTEIWITENSESSDSLSSQRRTYQTQLNNSTENLVASDGGILVLSCDAQEEKFTSETMSDITPQDIKSSYDIQYLSKTTGVEAGNPVFKIITNNKWYICAYIDSSVAADWKVGDKKTIKASVDKTEKSVDVKINNITQGDTDTFVIFETDKSILDFLSVRNIEFYITDSSYQGIKIPNTAIIEKTFIKIPVGCVVESLSGKSVVKRTDGKDELVSIDIESQDDEYAYIRQDLEALKIGDTVLMGTGETATEYKLSEVSTKVGVLTANGAYAKFAGITVLGQNSEYTIADPSSSSLKAYDKIISMAEGMNEGDEIY